MCIAEKFETAAWKRKRFLGKILSKLPIAWFVIYSVNSKETKTNYCKKLRQNWNPILVAPEYLEMFFSVHYLGKYIYFKCIEFTFSQHLWKVWRKINKKVASGYAVNIEFGKNLLHFKIRKKMLWNSFSEVFFIKTRRNMPQHSQFILDHEIHLKFLVVLGLKGRWPIIVERDALMWDLVR